MRHDVLAAAALSVCLAAVSDGPVPVWTEADALAAFERGSPALSEARAAEEAARGDRMQAGLVPNPTLTASASNFPLRANTTPSGNGNGIGNNLVTTVELDQPIELGGKRRRRIAQADAAVAEASLARADALRTARFELVRAFWHAVRSRSRRELAERLDARYAETIRITRARFQRQDISRLDLDKVELEGMKNESDLDDARAEERASVQELLTLVGPVAPPAVEVRGELALKTGKVDLDRLVERARTSRPDVLEAERRVDGARAAVRLAEAQAVPDLTVGVGYTRSRAIAAGDNPDALAVTLGLPLPLFSRNQGEIQKARVALAAGERARDAPVARTRQVVVAAYARYAAAVSKVARYEGGALERADRALEVAEKSYRAGDTGLLEFLEAERTWIALRSDYLDTLFEQREAALALESAAGVPSLAEAT